MLVSAATSAHDVPVPPSSSLVPSKAYSAMMSIPSESFQILQQRSLLRRIEIRPPAVARIAVRGERRIEARAGGLGIHAVGHEAAARLVVDVVTTPEEFGPPIERLEQIGQRRHRSIVQIRRPQPEAVERHGGVALGLPEV